MNPVPRAPVREKPPSATQQLHTQVEALSEQGIDAFVFASDGRILDAGRACFPGVLEQLAATCSGLVTTPQHCTGKGTHESLVVRYTQGTLLLLSITPAVWVGAVVDRECVKDAAHTLTLFTHQVAHLVPDRITRELQVMPSVLVGAY